MANDGKYSVFSEDSDFDSSPNVFALYELLRDDKAKKHKKKGKKGKKKKEKALDYLLSLQKEGKKKGKGKKGKKAKKGKSSKKAMRKLKHRLIEMTTEKSLDTASYGAKRYCDHKWPVDNNWTKDK